MKRRHREKEPTWSFVARPPPSCQTRYPHPPTRFLCFSDARVGLGPIERKSGIIDAQGRFHESRRRGTVAVMSGRWRHWRFGLLATCALVGALVCGRPPVALVAVIAWFEHSSFEDRPSDVLLKSWLNQPDWWITTAAGAVLGLAVGAVLGRIVRTRLKPRPSDRELITDAQPAGSHFHWRRWVVAAGAVLVAACWLWPAHVGPPFSRSQYNRIRLGMTREQVLAVVGCTPGHYVSNRDRASRSQQPHFERDTQGGDLFALPPGKVQVHDNWADPIASISVTYVDGTVYWKQWFAEQPPWRVELAQWLDQLRGLVGL